MAYKQLSKAYDKEIYVSVNLSIQQIIQNDIERDFIAILDKHNVSASHFCLELSELAYLEENEFINNNIIALKNIGFRFAIDDFGMRYSLLSVMDKLLSDIVKIDRYFINRIGNNFSCTKVLSTMADISNEFDKGLVAEGVETAEIKELLEQAGFRYAQGYLFYHPMPLLDLLPLMKQLKTK